MSLTVSVIITSYNKEKLLLRALQSLNTQEYSNFEVIIIDDCSTNQDTIDTLNKLKSEKRYSIYRNPQNMGPGYSKNRGTEIATGEIIVMLDSDDTLPPKAIQSIRQTFEKNPNAGFVFGNYEKHLTIENTVEYVDCSILAKNNQLQPERLVTNWILLGSSPYKKSAWKQAGGFNTIHHVSDDVDFFKKMMLLEIPGIYADDSIYSWHFNKKASVNTSGSKFEFWLARLRMIDFEFKYSKTPKALQLIKVSIATFFTLLFIKRKKSV